MVSHPRDHPPAALALCGGLMPLEVVWGVGLVQSWVLMALRSCDSLALRSRLAQLTVEEPPSRVGRVVVSPALGTLIFAAGKDLTLFGPLSIQANLLHSDALVKLLVDLPKETWPC